jgi:hypothetical protein
LVQVLHPQWRRCNCSECAFVGGVRVKNDMGDGYCPEADRTLVGMANNGKTLAQLRRCPYYKPKKLTVCPITGVEIVGPRDCEHCKWGKWLHCPTREEVADQAISEERT